MPYKSAVNTGTHGVQLVREKTAGRVNSSFEQVNGQVVSKGRQTSESDARTREIVDLQLRIKNLEAQLRLERSQKHIPKASIDNLWLAEIFSAVAEKAQKLFFRRMLTEHVENTFFQDEVQIRDQTFRVRLEKVGDRELLQREVLEWLADPNHPTRPPLYKDRPKDARGHRMNEIEFFRLHYGRHSEAKAIYLDQLRQMDVTLANLLGQAKTKHDIPVGELISPKSMRINETLSALLGKASPTERQLIEVMAGSSYHREFD
ncbi:hypothetical protein [Limnohabitans radicicola]|uniref:Uncharacterized protein n=1 Tax=Limnohabitans radicicola TaxID=2771427 RepID=A0A927FKW2_9BURK|nr:hypothetical protein [Limnohabitans radicicola]MBD8051973.1 hypothetical protein [Limnohabitans radicicola]